MTGEGGRDGVVTVDDLDIYRTARLYIEQHGDEAPIIAAMKADGLMERGDMDGRAAWLRVVRAIKDLLRSGPESEDTVH